MLGLSFDCKSCGGQSTASQDRAAHEDCPLCGARLTRSRTRQGRPPARPRRPLDGTERVVGHTERAVAGLELLDDGHELQWVGRRLYVRGGGLGGLADEVCIDLPGFYRADDSEDISF